MASIDRSVFFRKHGTSPVTTVKTADGFRCKLDGQPTEVTDAGLGKLAAAQPAAVKVSTAYETTTGTKGTVSREFKPAALAVLISGVAEDKAGNTVPVEDGANATDTARELAAAEGVDITALFGKLGKRVTVADVKAEVAARQPVEANGQA